jgi:myo-inositol-1(or 4)-monophosphatase
VRRPAAAKVRRVDAPDRSEMPDADALLEVLVEAVQAVGAALKTVGPQERRLPGERPGQYHLDLVADAAMCAVLHRAGLEVLSEESGRTGPPGTELLVVADPVDGSTNASLGLPWFATSLCILDASGPFAAIVANQVDGTRYEAVRGRGACRNGEPIEPSACDSLSRAVVGVSGLPAYHPGWAQFRALGAASLDLCAVAAGMLDGYRVAGGGTLHSWDYLGAMLVCVEAGVPMEELDGQNLAVPDATPRRPVAAATTTLLEQLRSAAI